MAARSYLLFLEDMQEAMERISRYCAGLDFAGFCTNELVVDGVVRNIEVIGEAAKKVPPGWAGAVPAAAMVADVPDA